RRGRPRTAERPLRARYWLRKPRSGCRDRLCHPHSVQGADAACRRDGIPVATRRHSPGRMALWPRSFSGGYRRSRHRILARAPVCVDPGDRARHREGGRLMSASAKLFEAERKRLFTLGYRMLGKVSEAEDVVQEAWLRYATAKSEIRDAP